MKETSYISSNLPTYNGRIGTAQQLQTSQFKWGKMKSKKESQESLFQRSSEIQGVNGSFLIRFQGQRITLFGSQLHSLKAPSFLVLPSESSFLFHERQHVFTTEQFYQPSSCYQDFFLWGVIQQPPFILYSFCLSV